MVQLFFFVFLFNTTLYMHSFYWILFPFYFTHEFHLNIEILIILCLLLCFIHFTKLTTDERIQSTFNVKTFRKCIHTKNLSPVKVVY